MVNTLTQYPSNFLIWLEKFYVRYKIKSVIFIKLCISQESHMHKFQIYFFYFRIFLTELNGNPNKQNALGETPLHLVCQGDITRCIANLERRAACLNLLLQWHTAEEKLDLACEDFVRIMFVLPPPYFSNYHYGVLLFKV